MEPANPVDGVPLPTGTDSLARGQASVLESIMRERPLGETLDLLTHVIEGQLPGLLCSVLLLDEDGVHVRHGAAPSLPSEFVKAIDGLPIGPEAGSCGTAMHTGCPVIVADILIDPIWRAYRDFTAPTGLRACWSTPIRFRGGPVLGAFAMYYREPRRPTTAELELIRTAVHLAGVAIGRRKEEETRRRVEEALRLSEERFRGLVENSSEVFFTADAEGNLTYASPALEAVTGWAPHEAVGRTLMGFFPEEDLPAVREAFARRLNGSLVTMEHRLLTRAGEVRWMRTSSRPMRSDGKTVGLYAVMMDITARKLAEEQLRQSQKMEAIGRLAGGIAHDFNNLLTAINGYSSLSLSQLDSSHPVRDHLLEILKSGERAAGLTRQLLAYSRKQILAPAVLNLNAIVSDMQGMLKRVLGEDVLLVSYLAPDLRPIRADRGQMEQILLNLAVNARDAMPNGGRLVIETSNLPGGEEFLRPGGHRRGAVRLSVRDTGMGMTAEVKARLFEPFFTTKALGKGTGLGLSVVYGIATQSEGTVTVESQPGKGTAFHVFLPESAGEPTGAGPAPAAAFAVKNRGDERILLAEDEESVRTFASKVLEALGYQVLTARNGLEALRLLEEQGAGIRLVITDMVMPEMGGDELAEQVKRLHPGLPLLFISGYHEGGSRERVPNGKAPVLCKPFSPDSLGTRVRQLLDRAAALEARG